MGNDTTATIENGAVTVFEGHVVSVARDGRFAFIDGTRTESVALGAPTSVAVDNSAGIGEDDTGFAESTIVMAGALGQRLLLSVWQVLLCMTVAVLALI